MKALLIAPVLMLVNDGLSQSESDYSQSQKIIGSWFLMDHGYAEAYTTSLIAFTKEGRKCVVGTDYNLHHEGRTETTYWDNTWKVENGYLLTNINKDSSSYPMPGHIIRDKILLLEEGRMNVLMETDGDYVPSLEMHIKLEGEDPSRICEIVDKHFNSKEKGAEISGEPLLYRLLPVLKRLF